jgi:8-oxo-dGTP pyrophosphatase MutT (NUDIX family)
MVRDVQKIMLAAAVVILGDRILIVRRSKKEGFLPRQWGVPCGKIGEAEDPAAAVLRELAEEAGLKGVVTAYVGFSKFTSTYRGQETENVQQNFWVTPAAGARRWLGLGRTPRVRTPRWDQRARWVHRDRLDRAGLDEHNLTTIRQVLEHVDKAPEPSALAVQLAD